MIDRFFAFFVLPGVLGTAGYLVFLVVTGALFGRLANLVSRRRYAACLAAGIPAAALACFATASGIAFARELDVTWWDFAFNVGVLTAFAWTVSMIGAAIATRPAKLRIQR